MNGRGFNGGTVEGSPVNDRQAKHSDRTGPSVNGRESKTGGPPVNGRGFNGGKIEGPPVTPNLNLDYPYRGAHASKPVDKLPHSKRSQGPEAHWDALLRHCERALGIGPSEAMKLLMKVPSYQLIEVCALEGSGDLSDAELIKRIEASNGD